MAKPWTNAYAQKVQAEIEAVGTSEYAKANKITGRQAQRLLAKADKYLGVPKRRKNVTRAAEQKAAQKEQQEIKQAEQPAFVLPDFPEEDMPFADLIDNYLIPATQKKLKHENSKEWFPVKIKSKGAYMLLALGDQHIDDPYCAWAVLKQHVELAAAHEHIYVLPMGDLHNNWVGGLSRLYAGQDMSRDRAYRGIEWLLLESKMKIPVLLLGNHDVWNEGKQIIKQMLKGTTTAVMDWSAKFKLVSPNGREVWINAAHDHKGHSQFNALHAQKRTALFGKRVDAFIGAHRHTPGFSKDWWPEERRTSWYVRPGSYKYFDMHAVTNGFPNYQDAPAMALIIDPDTTGTNPIVHVTDDIEHAVLVLDSLNKKKSNKKH